MPIGIPVLAGKISLFAWDDYFLHRDPTLLVKMGRICLGWLFSQRDAHIYCENGHPGAYIHVNIGIGMPIVTSKWASGMRIFGDAYIHLTPVGVRMAVGLGGLCSISYPLCCSHMLKIVPIMPKIMPKICLLCSNYAHCF